MAKLTMLRVYRGTNGQRLVHEHNVTIEEANDTDRFPLGYMQDAKGWFMYQHVLTECLKPENYEK
jgi:hypothetical protein